MIAGSNGAHILLVGDAEGSRIGGSLRWGPPIVKRMHSIWDSVPYGKSSRN